MLSTEARGRWGATSASQTPRGPALRCRFPPQTGPFRLLPGQWWVSVGTDDLVGIYSMPAGAVELQVPRGGGGSVQVWELNAGVLMQRPPKGPGLNCQQR